MIIRTISLVVLSLILLLLSCNQTNKTTTLAFQPYESFDAALIDTISKVVKDYYQFDVITLPSKKLPSAAYIAIKTPRYRADSLIKFQRIQKPDSIDYVLGLTNKDISSTKRNQDGTIKEPTSRYTDWGIFGLGYSPGSSCIVSTYRLRKSKTKTLLIERLKKICLHEIGHNLGLPHCKSSGSCFMKDAAESIKTIDNEPLDMCSSCKSKI